MAKRQSRSFQADILINPTKFLSLEVNLILVNNNTMHGKIVKLLDNSYIVKDMFGGSHKISLPTIEEIVTDYISTY